MRRLIFSFALAALALSVSAQDLDKILDDHFKASGQDKLSKITSISIQGKLVAMGMETEITIYQKRPNKLRIEASLMGQKMIQTYNGTKGWTYAPAMGASEPIEMGTEELRGVLNQANMDSPFWDYEAKGNQVELLGSSEDGSAHKLKLTSPELGEITIFISKETSLITQINSVQSAQGMEMEIETELKDYKDVKGIPTAHYIGSKMAGQPISTITLSSIEYNKSLDASLFEKPVME
jgi:outer membrane lipoprotein-sorting protein